MDQADKSFQAAHELGRVYDAITDRKVLADFFLNTVLRFIPAKNAYLFLMGQHKALWLDTQAGASSEIPEGLLTRAQQAFDDGKAMARDGFLFLPVIASNAALGIACLERMPDAPAFEHSDVELGFDLTSHFSGALKNILLFEENLKMERLAAVGQAMGMVLHELKNILQLAKFSDEMIRMGIADKNEKFLQKGLEKLTKILKEMDGFTWEMMSLTKNYQMEPEPMHISKLLGELQSDLADRAAGYEVGLDFEAEANFPEVEGDQRSLYRALLNLIKNAFEAFQEKTNACIKIRARVIDEEHYEITVEDNGSGMTEEVRARLFEAFFSTKGKRGTGLGLLVVARTVKAHLGNVRVESKAGEGTKFILTLARKIPRN